MRIDIITVDGSPKKIIPENIETGIGGAELSLLTWAEMMGKRGHKIRIFNNPIKEGDLYTNVTFLNDNHFREYEPNRDAVIMFRGPQNIQRSNGTRKYIGWSCDQYTNKEYNSWYNFVDDMVLISEFHKNDHISRWKLNPDQINKIQVFDLGVRTWEYQQPIEKIKNTAIFCSVPDRGLSELLQLWSRIKQINPELKLTITSDYRLWGCIDPGNSKWRLQSVGMKDINFLGKVDRSALVKLQLQSEIQLYPHNYDENFCIAVAECQVAGAIPFTSNQAAVATTNFCGYQTEVHSDSPFFEGQFLKNYQAYYNLSDEEKNLKREETIKKANMRFDWETICNQWENILA